MTRLKDFLLAGTVVPALVLAPIAGASAQTPANEHHGAEPGGPHAGAHGDARDRGAPAGAREAPRSGAATEREAPRAAREAPRAAPAAYENSHVAAPAAHESERTGAPPHEGARAGGATAHEGIRAGSAAGREEPRGSAPGAAREGTHAGAPGAGREGTHAGPPGAHRGVHDDTAGAHEGSHAGAAGEGREGTRAGAPGARAGVHGDVPAAGEGSRAGTPANRDVAEPGSHGQHGPASREGARTDVHPEGSRAGAPGANVVTPGERGGPHGSQAETPAGTPHGMGGRPNASTAAPGGVPGAAPGRGGPGGGGVEQGQKRHGIGAGGAAAIGAAAGFAGGFLAATTARRLDDVRGERQERTEDGRTFIREPGRTIVEENGHAFIVHDEDDRFRELGYAVRRERSGRDTIDVIDRPGGIKILTFTDPDGRMLRRVRRYPDGHEVVLIDNGYDGRVRPPEDDVVELPPPPVAIPQDRYIVDYADADENVIYDTLEAPPLQPPPQRYTLDQIRYSPDVRRYVRAVDINTINFDSGSWVVPASATGKLRALGTAIKRAVDRNPNAVFLVEGFTDATGNPTDNLSLSDHRAQSVAAILSRDFGVPPENLTTQGYGQQNPKVNTQGSSAANRRVVVQNITSLLAAGGAPPPR